MTWKTEAASLKRRITKGRCNDRSMTRITLIQALLVLFVAIWTDGTFTFVA